MKRSKLSWGLIPFALVAASCSDAHPSAMPSATSGGSSSGGVAVSGAGTATTFGGSPTVAGQQGAGGAVGTGGVGGDAAPAGGSATGGSAGAAGAGGGGTRAPNAPGYNGLRGKEFNQGWRFNRGEVANAQQPSFDDSGWKALDVPHDWSIELPFNSSSKAGAGGGYLDGGIGWYRKSFTLDASSQGKRVFIEFDGVYMNSEVWVNGVSVGKRPYGYTSFEYDLTEHVKLDGTPNVLAVKVNNEQPNSRWYSGSGIYRNVWLTELAPVHIPNSGVFVTTPQIDGSMASVVVKTDVTSTAAAAMVSLTTTITDENGAKVGSAEAAPKSIAAGASASFEQTLSVSSPSLWSPAAPHLYRVEVQVRADGVLVDTYVTPLGFRQVKFSPTSGFSLNGQAMKLQGVNMHHDLGALGAAVSYRAIERQVEILKRMGVNAIRTSHNPPAPELLEISDRLGVMILDEAFDTWKEPKNTNDYARSFDAWAERDIKDMVRRDRNHPSVILWSIGNEVGGSTISVAQNLKNWVLAVDSTRAVTWASNKMGGPHVGEGDDRNVADLLDVQGYNYAGYAGDYDADHSAHPDWCLLGTETSAALRSRGVYHTPAGTVTKATGSSRADKQSSSYDNETTNFGDTAEVAYARDMSRPFVAGSFIWAGFDYIGEPTPYGWPAKSSYYGAIDTAGFPKDVFYFYQSRWTSAPMVHLLPHWNHSAGTTVTVYAYHNCDSAELFLNDVSQGDKPFAGTALHSEWSIPWQAGTLRAECKRGGAVAATDVVKTAGTAAKIGLSVDRERIHADGKDLAFITADVLDRNGTFVPTADSAFTFSVSGPATLVGVDNGNPIDTAAYQANTRKAFNGKALAIIRSTKSAGMVTFTASAAGLAAASVHITTE